MKRPPLFEMDNHTVSGFSKSGQAARLNMETGVNGLDSLLENMNKEIEGIANRTAKGVISAAAFVARVAKLRTPLNTGHLRASQQILNGNTASGNPIAEVGYSASYALPVHENIEAKFKEGGAKFLESALNESRETVIDIIKQNGFVK